MKAFSAIKSVLRQLRYLEIDKPIGEKILINSFQTIEADVRRALASEVGCFGSLVSEQSHMLGTLRKYRLLDLKFEAVPPVQPLHSVDLRFLKDLGFLADTEDLKDSPFFKGNDSSFLDDIIEQVGENRFYVLVFLVDPELDLALRQGYLRDLGNQFDAASHFPREMFVRDVCLTNYAAIWLSKHLYM